MILNVNNVTIAYGTNNPIVHDVSFSLQAGEVLALVGESGSGKTSIIRAIQQCLPANARIIKGEILYKGENILTLNSREKRALCGTAISTIFQDSGNMMNPIKTIEQQFSDYLIAHGFHDKQVIYQKIVAMLNLVKLPNPELVAKSYTFELSGGMRQRVGIAMAMALTPCLLLADEPTSALDVTTQAQIIQQMMQLKEELNVAIILVTHNLGVASYMADHILIMKDGYIVERGTKKTIVTQPQHAYTKTLLDAIPH